MSTAQPGIISIQRKNTKDIKIRDLYVEIDGGPKRNIKFGAEIEIELQAGDHELLATNRMSTKKSTFSLGPGEKLSYEVVNAVGGCFSIFAVVGTGGYIVELNFLDSEKGPAAP